MKNQTTENKTFAGKRPDFWEEQIRNRAYELYLARNGGPGSALEDWLRAEAELEWKLSH